MTEWQGRDEPSLNETGPKVAAPRANLEKQPFSAGMIGVPDSVTIERVAAFVVIREGHAAAAEDLRAFARLHIADYKVPEEMHFRDVLPKNPVGKV